MLAFNQEVDESTARQITEPNRFIECVIAPGYTNDAFELLTTRPTWKKNVRILRTGPLTAVDPNQRTRTLREVDGGMLVQSRDRNDAATDFAHLRVVTKRPPTPLEMKDLAFGWVVCKHVKSNAIVLSKNEMVVGVGAGR